MSHQRLDSDSIRHIVDGDMRNNEILDFGLPSVGYDDSLGASRKKRIRHKLKKLSPAKRKAVLVRAFKAAAPNRQKRVLAMALKRRAKIKKGAAKVKVALAKNPKFRAAIIKRLAARKLKAVTKASTDWQSPRLDTSTSDNAMPMVAKPSPPPTAPPVQPGVEEDHTPTDSETVEESLTDEALDTAENVDEANEEAADQVKEDVAENAEEQVEASTDEELSEPTDEEASEEAAEEAEAESEASGEENPVLGAIKKAVRKKARRKRTLKAAKPVANALQAKSKGKIAAKDTMRGCALIQAAKGGNPKAKAAIKALQVAAKKGSPTAKKSLAQLRVCQGVLKKARATVKAKVSAPPKKRTVYNTPVKVVSKGLSSYSAHQRGLAMIPTTARNIFRSVK